MNFRYPAHCFQPIYLFCKHSFKKHGFHYIYFKFIYILAYCKFVKMKKTLLLFAFSALALTSCKDDDIQAYEMDMMKGDWKISKKEVISGKDDKTALNTEVPTGCSVKNNLEFRTDYYTSFTTYGGTGTDCQVATKLEGTYTYNSDTKDLVVTYKNNSPVSYRIVVLTSSEMRIKQTSGNIDQNGDTIVDAEYITYK